MGLFSTGKYYMLAVIGCQHVIVKKSVVSARYGFGYYMSNAMCKL